MHNKERGEGPSPFVHSPLIFFSQKVKDEKGGREKGGKEEGPPSSGLQVSRYYYKNQSGAIGRRGEGGGRGEKKRAMISTFIATIVLRKARFSRGDSAA